MKNLVFAAALAAGTLGGAPATAQTIFAPNGAEWWYDLMTVSCPYAVRVYAAGDTVLPAHAGAWRVLRAETYLYHISGACFPVAGSYLFAFTQVRGNQVWVAQGSSEQKILDFGLLPGSTDTVTYCTGPSTATAVLRLDSVLIQPWGGAPSRVQWHSSSLGSGGYQPLREFTGMAAERMGYHHALLVPVQECGTDPDVPQLLFYTDSGGTFGQRPRVIMSTPHPVVALGPQLVPNPSATGVFAVEDGLTEPLRYRIFDTQGRCVQTGRLTGSSPALSLATLPAGLYLLRGEMAGRPFARRLVRE